MLLVFFPILFSIYLTLRLCTPKLSADDMWIPWVVDITHILWLQVSHECHRGPHFFSEKRIKVGKEEAGTSNFNKSYDMFKSNQDKAQTRKLLEILRQKVHGQINQWQIIMIVSTAIHFFCKILDTFLWCCKPWSSSSFVFCWLDKEDCTRS